MAARQERFFPREFFEEAYWKKATIPRLKDFLKILGLPVSGNKPELLHRILDDLGPPQNVEVPPGRTYHNVEDFLQVMAKPIGKRKVRPIALPRVDVQPAPRFKSGWVNRNANRITVDHAKMKAIIEANFDGYGDYSIWQVAEALTLPVTHRDPDIPFVSQINALEWDQHAVNVVLREWWTTGDEKVLEKFPQPRGLTNAEIRYDTGANPPEEGGYPAVAYTYNDLFTLKTFPFGLGSIRIKRDHLIEIDGVEIATYNVFRTILDDEKNYRAFRYLLIQHPEVKPIVKFPQESRIVNVVSLAKQFVPEATPDLFRQHLKAVALPPLLSVGRRLALEHFVKTNFAEEVVLRPARPELESYFEERLTPEAWANLPDEYKRSRIPSVPEPYRLLSQKMAKEIYGSLDMDYPAGLAAEQALMQLDEIFPDWGKGILGTPATYRDLQKLNVPSLVYYAAHLGLDYETESIKRNPSVAPDPEGILPLIYMLANLRDLWPEGLPATLAEARPISTADFERLLSDIVEPYEMEALLRRLGQHLKIPNLDLLDVGEIRRTLEAGYQGLIEIPPTVAARNDIWTKLSDVQREMMEELYGPAKKRQTFAVTFARQTVVSPLERYIIALSAESLETIIKNLGLVVPDHLSRMYYVRNAIPRLEKIFQRREGQTVNPLNTEYLTDDEIIRASGAMLGYSSRETLVKAAVGFLAYRPTFFIPLVRKSRNVKLITDPLDDNTPLDPKAFVIAYGSRRPLDEKTEDYISYTPEEIIQANTVSRGDVGAQLTFRLYTSVEPVTYREVSLEDVVALKDLLLTVRKWNPSTGALLKVVSRYFKAISEISDYDRSLIRTFSTLDQRATLKPILLALFELGMTFRQWEGPGHPYPVRALDAKREGWDPIVETREAVSKLRTLLSAAALSVTFDRGLQAKTTLGWFFINLRIVEHRDRSVVQYTEISYDRKIYRSIGQLLDDVLNGRFCIRVASKYVIGTGHYYLNLLFKETIPGYDPKDLELIQ